MIHTQKLRSFFLWAMPLSFGPSLTESPLVLFFHSGQERTFEDGGYCGTDFYGPDVFPVIQ